MICAFPTYVEAAGGLVSCGRCHQCRIDRKNKKVGRCALEARTNEGDPLFVTLTYKQDYLPIVLFDTRTGEVEYSHPTGCLDKRAVQLFIKRLLRRFPPRTIRYFYAGEYGGDYERPHYHMVLWGVPWKKRYIIRECWSDPNSHDPYCDPDRVDIQLPKSYHDVAQYCCGYIMKARTNVNDDKTRAWLDGRPPEFFQSSKGLGLKAVEAFKNALLGCTDLPRSFLLEGKSYPIDRYLSDKILDALPNGEVIREKRRQAFAQEMSALQATAFPNQKLNELLGYQINEKILAEGLRKQYISQNAVELELTIKRQQFFDRKT